VKRIICIILVILLMFATLGLYLWGIVMNGDAPSDKLLQFLAIEFSALATLIRVIKGTGHKRRNLSFYERHYADQLGRAFENDPKIRRQLLEAIRLYNENKFDDAIENLLQLKRCCRNTQDRQAVLMFTALCYSDSNQSEKAISEYEKLLEENPYHNSALGNLAILYMQQGNYAAAEPLYQRAIDAAPEEGLGYHNLASLYYRMNDYDRAIDLFQKALEKKHTLYQAAATLSIIFALRGETQESRKFFEQAVTNGQNAQNLRTTIDRRLSEQEEIRQFARHISQKTARFDGDILITDPTFFINSNEDWETCKHGERLDLLGIQSFLTFSQGDAVGTTLINTENDDILGEFASDSCMVSVILLSEVLAYRSNALKDIPSDCYTVIHDFHGIIRAEMDEENHATSCWKLIGEGNIPFESIFD